MSARNIKGVNKGKEQNENISVFVRVRPRNTQESHEKGGRSAIVLECQKDRNIVAKERSTSIGSALTKTFTFDRVFGPESQQVDVYKAVVKPLIGEVLEGYNCTVFAYGQTGTGKTFTMEGERSCNDLSWEQDPSSGIVPRVLNHMFDELRMKNLDFTMGVTYLELYNEELIDLLSPIDDTSKLKLFEDATQKGSVLIQGLQEILVLDKKEVYDIMKNGALKRQTAATNMNAHSSRSHTIFTVTVHIRESTDDGEELLRTGKINLVDLAGSENIGRSGAKQQRAREAGNINQSLLTLGRVITALVEHAPHVPYRESKLTRLLQDSLGGRTKTSIIATVSPVLANFEETMSTLDYAHRAKSITNRPEINQRLTKKALLKDYTVEIERLRRDLAATRDGTGVYLAHENFVSMQTRLENQEIEITEKLTHIKALEEERDKRAALFAQLEIDLQERSEQLAETTTVLLHTRDHLATSHVELAETSELLNHHRDTERELSDQAGQLLQVADQASGELGRVHDKIDRKRTVEEHNEGVLQEFRQTFSQRVAQMKDSTLIFAVDQERELSHVRAKLGEALQHHRKIETSAHEQAADFLQSHTRSTQALEAELRAQAEAQRLWSQEQLQATRDGAEAQVSALQAALAQALTRQQEMAVSALRLQSGTAKILQDILRKVDSQEAGLRQFMEQQGSVLAELQHEVAGFTQQMETSLATRLEHGAAMEEHMDSAYQEMEAKMAAQIALLQSSQQFMQAHRQQSREKFSQLAAEGEQEASLVAKHAQTLRQHVAKAEMEGATLQRSSAKLTVVLKQDVQLCGESLSEGLDAVSEGCTAAGSDLKALETMAVRGWREHASAQEEQLRGHADLAQENLQAQTPHLLDLRAVTLHQVETQGVLAEGRHTSLSEFLGASQQQLAEQAHTTTAWSDEHVLKLNNVVQEADKALVTNFRKDLPTGSTPTRKVMEYPRQLQATSPHERILQRFRERMQEATTPLCSCKQPPKALRSNSECDSDSGRDGSKSTSSNNSSSSSDEVTITRSQSEVNLATSPENKENGQLKRHMRTQSLKNLTKMAPPPVPEAKPKRRILGSQN